MRTQNYRTYYQSAGEDFEVRMIPDGKSLAMETVLDKTNMVAIQIFGVGGPSPMYNAGRFKYPTEAELKVLELVATDATKQILGVSCKKYTYSYKQIFGEVWLTDKIGMSNDLGVFRAAKMAALHNSLSVPGFVMEMSTQDATGAKTLMKTVSLRNAESYTVDFKSVSMQTAINTVNYYVF